MLFVFNNIRILFLIIVILVFLLKSKGIPDLRPYKRYINICKKFKKLFDDNEKNISNQNSNKPFFSICIPVFNMEKYIKLSLLSVLNQSFRDFEIVIINDNSLDTSEKIIKIFQSKNSNIRLINHGQNLGVYKTRVDAIKNAKGNYIMFLDPDDMFSYQNLLNDLYEFNIIHHQDIIEFSLIIYEERYDKLYYPLEHRRNHFHNFNEQIIFHPKLSNILFFENEIYSDIICRCLWNKMIRKDVLFKTINFLGFRTYEQDHFNFAEDTIINILNFEFASNYSNLNLIGYMYNVRIDSMSHSNKEKEMDLKMASNVFFFYQLFYKYIKYFNKDLNYLYFDLKAFDYFFKYLKQYNSSYQMKKPIIRLYQNFLKESNISVDFKNYAKKFLSDFGNKSS